VFWDRDLPKGPGKFRGDLITTLAERAFARTQTVKTHRLRQSASEDFIHEGGSEREKCLRTGSEKRQLLALGFSGDAKLTPSVVRASTQHWKLGWILNSEALGCTLPVVRKLKTEILV